MKNFTKKSILQKTILTILVIVIVSNFIIPTISKAATKDEVGGVLFTPIQYLVLGIGDTLMYFANAAAYGVDVDPILTLSTIDTPWYVNLGIALGLGVLTIATFGTGTLVVAGAAVVAGGAYFGLDNLPNEIDIPIFLVSPERIFFGAVPSLDINIFNPKEYEDSEGNTTKTPVQELQQTIASWYVAIRNLVIVGLLLLLVYVGIRIIISSAAADKAKYKQMFTDWVIALCLLFFMHYIMNFSIAIVESITKTMAMSAERIEIPITIADLESKYTIEDEQKAVLEGLTIEEGGNINLDLMGLARFKAQLDGGNYTDENGEALIAEGGRAQMAYTIIYFVLVIYTIMFLAIYIKRFVYIVFLTMMAPLVALSYPIDKMNDGQAQAFNTWLKEYIFNLLIQPLHLILYMVLLGSAMELATEYMLYPLVVLGFMLQAEKLLRKFFGFEKASTASSIASGAFGGAAVMGAINKLGSGAKKAIKGGKGSSGGSDGNNDRIRMAERGADNPSGENDFINETLNDGSTMDNRQDEGIDNNESNNINTFPDDDMSNYYNNQDNGLDDNQSINDRMAQIEAEDPNFTSNPEWMALNEEQLRQEYEQQNNESDEIPGNIETIDEPDNSESRSFRGARTLGRVFKGVAGVGGRYLPTIGKGILKGSAMALGAGTLGTIGIAAGLASDDFANVAKYGAGAAAVGAVAGGKAYELPSAAYRKVAQVGGDIRDTYQKSAYTKQEYNQKINDRLDNEFMKNKENIALYKRAFENEGKRVNSKGKEVAAYKVAMEKAVDYRRHGVTDNETIIKAMKAKNGTGDWNDRKRIVSAKFASQVTNEKDIETLEKRLKEKGISDRQVKAQANTIREIKGFLY